MNSVYDVFSGLSYFFSLQILVLRKLHFRKLAVPNLNLHDCTDYACEICL